MPNIFENLLEIDFRWPKPGDLALTSHPDLSGAEIAKNPLARAVFMIDGYKEAANLLVEKAMDDRFLRHQLVYPILFCYRHLIELWLKYVISEYGHIAELPSNWKDHNLDVLWGIFRKIHLYAGEGDIDALNAVEAVVAEFAKIDSGSFTFRYPMTRGGELIEINMDNIDLWKLRDTMAGIDNFFSGADGYLDSLSKNDPY